MEPHLQTVADELTAVQARIAVGSAFNFRLCYRENNCKTGLLAKNNSDVVFRPDRRSARVYLVVNKKNKSAPRAETGSGRHRLRVTSPLLDLVVVNSRPSVAVYYRRPRRAGFECVHFTLSLSSLSTTTDCSGLSSSHQLCLLLSSSPAPDLV